MSRWFRHSNAPASTNPPQSSDLSPHHGYDPNQPRVPAGHHGGGQWTNRYGAGAPSIARRDVTVDRTGKESWNSFANAYRADGLLTEQRVFNRDGSRIVSEYRAPDEPGDWDERHTVISPDGRKVTFETTGNVQRIYDADGRLISASVWTKDGPEPLSDKLAFAPAIPFAAAAITAVEFAAVLVAGAALFAWLSSQNNRKNTAVFGFSSPTDVDPDGKPKIAWVGRLTEDELKQTCKKYENVQKFTDEAARAAWTNRKDWSATGFGTEVHTRVAREINGKVPGTDEFRSPRDPQDPNFRAEYSVLKKKAAIAQAGGSQAPDPQTENGEPNPRYGQKGTVRVDALENRGNGTVCVYDIKTGERPLYFPRMEEIARSVYRYYPGTQNIVVAEVRPRWHR